MLLKDSYFKISNKKSEDSCFNYELQLIPTHIIYHGHFPDKPISPGVCSIEIIRECCEDALNIELTLISIKQCRFITILTPYITDILTLQINITTNENLYNVSATLANKNTTFVNFKGSFEPNNNK